MLTNNPRSIDEFQLGEIIGKGAFGVVHRAYDTVNMREVAIKSITHGYDSRRLSRAEQEVSIMESLDHPNIVKMYGSIEEKGVRHIIMEYCPNGSVSDAMERSPDKRLPIDVIRSYMFDLAQAVRYMHTRIIVHRDLKPGNMLIDANGKIKLCDFGLATTVSQLKLEGNTICGTMNYISPEIYNQKGVTTVADVWSYGCVLYALVVGRPPFSSMSKETTRQLATEGAVEIPDDIDLDAADLIRKLLTKNIQERPQMANVISHQFFNRRSRAVEPQKCPFNGGCVNIQADGAIVLDLANHPTLFKILPGANEVEVSTRSGSHRQTYELNRMPPKYKKRYEFALKIVRQAEQHKPLVIWNSDTGKFVMFADGSLGLVRGKKITVVPDGQKEDLKGAMRVIVGAVQDSGHAKWPVVVGMDEKK